MMDSAILAGIISLVAIIGIVIIGVRVLNKFEPERKN